ncbi:MAG: Arginine-tRNA ligase, partial [Candidatus Saccharibacteria bacterium]|nr:Arginine-tRNA ligase [Candidatus Saccharibacteria bacterium]
MKQILDTIQDTAVRLFNVEVTPELTRPNEQFGDYATNVALQLAGRLNKNPREIADALATELQTRLIEIVSNVTVAGPGFINIRLTDRAMLASATMPAAPGVYASKEMVIETNNPNPFKDMHIGHAYNSIVADTVANLLEAGQGNVHRVSYHGDVGLHVGKSMWAILKHIDYTPEQLGAIPENERAKFLSDMYAQGAVAYEQDDLAKQQIEAYSKQSFVLDDPIFEQVYTTCKEWSFGYFDQVFGLIGSKPTERRYLERETDQAGRATV